MKHPPLPTLQSPERLATLRRSGLLDSHAEEPFDRLTRLAARVLRVPVALVSLVTEDRQFFKSEFGLAEPWASQRETPLSHSFCQHVVNSGSPLIIPDAREHPLVRENLAIVDLNVVAYAGIPLRDSDGHVLGSFCAIDSQPRHWTDEEIGILSDLAESVMTEIELRATAERADRERRERTALLESTDHGIYGIDLQGRCTFVNRAGAALLGYEVEELLGRNMHQLIHHTRPDGTPYPEDRCPIFRAFRQGRGTRLYDEVLWRRDGTPLPVEYTSAPILEDGRRTGGVVTFTDISERKQAEEELRRQNALVELLQVVAVAANEAATVEDALQTTTSEICTRTAWPTGRVFLRDAEGPQSLVPTAIWHVAEPDGLAVFRAISASGFQDGVADRVFAEREAVWIEDLESDTEVGAGFGFPVLVEGEAAAVLEFFAPDPRPRDDALLHMATYIGAQLARVVERHQLLMRERSAREEAEAAVRTREEVLSVVSHDLRNPVGTIFMSSSFLLDLIGDDPARQTERKQLDIVKRSADRINRMIQDLLDVTRIESGRLSLECAPVNAASLVQEVHETYAPLATAHSLNLECQIGHDLPLVYADRDRLLQVFGNLIGNAVKFTPPGGTIRVGAEPAQDSIRFHVADTGEGVPKEHLAHLFNRFWQVNRSDRRGLGLGLAIVKGIVEGHGGTVWAESTPGEGSTFWFAVPAFVRRTGR